MASTQVPAGILAMISIQQLSVQYGTQKVLQNLSLDLLPGRVVGLIGANGSGKSTLVKAIAGQVPRDGQILHAGVPLSADSIGYMPQDLSGMVSLKVMEVVLLGRLRQLGLKVSDADLRSVESALKSLGIESLANRHISDLSGGQRQLVYLAQALISEPKTLLLDEPISALDIAHQLEVLELVRRISRERNLCTLMVLHDLNAAARFTDEIALLHGGTILASGAAKDVLTEDNIGLAFRVRMEVTSTAGGDPVFIPRELWN